MDDDNVNTQATTNAAVPIQISLINDILFGCHKFACPIYVLVPNMRQISCHLWIPYIVYLYNSILFQIPFDPGLNRILSTFDTYLTWLAHYSFVIV